MSQPEILEKAIQKAIDGGWSVASLNTKSDFSFMPSIHTHRVEAFEMEHAPTVNDVIFSHDFAKALWGDTPLHDTDYINDDDVADAYEGLPVFKFHLSRMVISEDPIKYLGENI